MLKDMLLAGVGGFIGTCGRYVTARICTVLFPGTFSPGTLIVNIIGCLLIGLICGISERTGVISQAGNLFLVTGICGGFTTFSAFANEIWTMGGKDDVAAAVSYTAISVVAGIACVWAGRFVAATIWHK